MFGVWRKLRLRQRKARARRHAVWLNEFRAWCTRQGTCPCRVLSAEAVEYVGGDLLDLWVASGEAVRPVGATTGDHRAAAGRGVGAEHGMAMGDAFHSLRLA